MIGDILSVNIHNETDKFPVTAILGQYITVGNYRFHYADDYYEEDKVWKLNSDGQLIVISI